MIRIVGVNRSDRPEKEFVLIQNQGPRRLTLRGHGLVAESAIESGSFDAAAFPLDEVVVPPGNFVLVISGRGTNRWGQTRDGARVYYCHMNRAHPIWNDVQGPIHVVSAQHTFVERDTYALV